MLVDFKTTLVVWQPLFCVCGIGAPWCICPGQRDQSLFRGVYLHQDARHSILKNSHILTYSID
jgi:hypothetical protein